MFTTNDMCLSARRHRLIMVQLLQQVKKRGGGGVKRLMRHYTLVVGDVVNNLVVSF